MSNRLAQVPRMDIDPKFKGCTRIDAVIVVLRETQRPMRVSEITAELNKGGVDSTPNHTSIALARAVQRGKVRRSVPGVYAIETTAI